MLKGATLRYANHSQKASWDWSRYRTMLDDGSEVAFTYGCSWSTVNLWIPAPRPCAVPAPTNPIATSWSSTLKACELHIWFEDLEPFKGGFRVPEHRIVLETMQVSTDYSSVTNTSFIQQFESAVELLEGCTAQRLVLTWGGVGGVFEDAESGKCCNRIAASNAHDSSSEPLRNLPHSIEYVTPLYTPLPRYDIDFSSGQPPAEWCTSSRNSWSGKFQASH